MPLTYRRWNLYSKTEYSKLSSILLVHMNMNIYIPQYNVKNEDLLVFPIQENLVLTRSSGTIELPCYIGYLIISGLKNNEIWRIGTSNCHYFHKMLLKITTFVTHNSTSILCISEQLAGPSSFLVFVVLCLWEIATQPINPQKHLQTMFEKENLDMKYFFSPKNIPVLIFFFGEDFSKELCPRNNAMPQTTHHLFKH